MDIHHATTPRNSTNTAKDVCRRRDSQNPQIANAAKNPASAIRKPKPRQVRIVNGQGGPCDEHDLTQSPDS